MENIQNCENCRQPFPKQKIDIHFAYCHRNIRKCQQCDDMIDISYVQEHKKNVHSKEACPHCKLEMDTKHIIGHKDQCHNRPIMCAYCEQQVQWKTFDEHQWECGSRTKICCHCQKPIVLREYDVHEATYRNLSKLATMNACTSQDDYLRKRREQLAMQKKYLIQPKPQQPIIDRVRKDTNNKDVQYQIKKVGTREVYVSKRNTQNNQQTYEKVKTTDIRTAIPTSSVRPTVYATHHQQPQMAFQDEDDEMQRALLQSMRYS